MEEVVGTRTQAVVEAEEEKQFFSKDLVTLIPIVMFVRSLVMNLKIVDGSALNAKYQIIHKEIVGTKIKIKRKQVKQISQMKMLQNNYFILA